MLTSGGRKFDFVRFSFIFLVWIIGAWFIIHTVNLADREGFALFDGSSYVRAEKAGLIEEMDVNEEMPEMKMDKE